METAAFARTGRRVSRLGFGAMGFAGWFGRQSEADHIRALHYALDQGVSFVDTARAYGESEEILGRGLRQWSGPKPFVATKVEGLAGGPQWATPVPVERSLPKGQVTASCEASLRALESYVPEHASSLAALALKFALWHPGVTTAITSMHEQRYARMNIAAAAEPRLRPDIFKKLMFKHRFIKSFMDVRNFADLDAVPDQPLAAI